jgi:hypothetical protein
MEMKNGTYDVLKYIALIILPALATLYAGLGKVWGLPFTAEIPATITLIDTFLGSALMISTNNYNKHL